MQQPIRAPHPPRTVGVVQRIRAQTSKYRFSEPRPQSENRCPRLGHDMSARRSARLSLAFLCHFSVADSRIDPGGGGRLARHFVPSPPRWSRRSFTGNDNQAETVEHRPPSQSASKLSPGEAMFPCERGSPWAFVAWLKRHGADWADPWGSGHMAPPVLETYAAVGLDSACRREAVRPKSRP
jgi:hypothetical protein